MTDHVAQHTVLHGFEINEEDEENKGQITLIDCERTYTVPSAYKNYNVTYYVICPQDKIIHKKLCIIIIST